MHLKLAGKRETSEKDNRTVRGQIREGMRYKDECEKEGGREGEREGGAKEKKDLPFREELA